MKATLLALLGCSLIASCKKNETTPAAAQAEPAPAAQPAPAAEAPKAAEPAKPAEAPAPEPPKPAEAAPAATGPLMQPANLTDKAPAKYKAKFTTNEGDFVIEVQREWAPNGADRFYNLVKYGYFDNVRFFRAIKGFMVQFGIHGDPGVNKAWDNANIQDDPVKQSNKRGMVTFAQTSMPNSRATQLFINLVDNTNLDGMRFAPVGKVVKGMDVVDKLHTGYGEGFPSGRGPDQMRIQAEGNVYLQRDFPELDFVKQAKIVK